MSLPPAPKDISDHPRAGSVVDPVNKELKDADVDRKIRLYGVIEAFRQGRMPNNTQIDQTLQYVLNNSPVDLQALSPEGRQLISDTQDIIETARLMVQEKNADELLQNFVWHTRDVDVDAAKKSPNEVLPISSDKAQEEGQLAVKHLRTILALVLTNSEVRKLITDFSYIGRDLLARGAAKATDALRPDPELMARVDHPAPHDQFITEGGRVAGTHETPVLEARVPGTDTTVSQHPKADLGTGATVRTGDGQVMSGEQAMGQARQQADQMANQAQDQAGYAADRAQSHYDDVQEGGPEVADEKKRTMMDKMRGVRDNLKDRIPQQHKDRANDHTERFKTFLSDEYFPEERRDQFIYRGKKAVIECQKHDDYQESMRWLIGYVEQYANHANHIKEHGKDSATTLTQDSALRQATRELRTLLERFANGVSMDLIFDAANNLITDANNDPELKQWWHQVDTYIRRCLLDVGFVLEPECDNQGKALRESGRRFYDVKYRDHFDNLFNSFGRWFGAMGDDPMNRRFADDWARLTKDLLFDAEGNLTFKPELWNDVRKVLLPTIVDKVGYVPIPRIEYTDDGMDFVIENLTLSGRNLFPNHVSIEGRNFVKFSPYSALQDQSHHEVTLTFGQIQADIRDVAFYFKKKTGFPKLSDSGLADAVLGGEGLTATVHLTSSDKDKSSVYKVKDVIVKIDHLNFSIRDSKHDVLYKTLKPLAAGLVKKQIQKAVADAIRTGLEYVDGQLVTVRDRMSAAKVTDGQSRTQVLKDVFAKNKNQAEAKKEEKVGNAEVRVLMDANSPKSVLPGDGHPAGISHKVAERSTLVPQGHDWRSDAFTIVSNPGRNATGITGTPGTAGIAASGPKPNTVNTRTDNTPMPARHV